MESMLMMEGAQTISPHDVAAAERKLGFALPPALVTLCLRQNGGTPNRSWLVDDEEQVDCFFPIKPQGTADAGGIVGIYQQMVGEGLIPANSIPFAGDGGGNLYLLDRATGHVWFMPMDAWDHEETAEQNWVRSGRTVADSLEAFLDALTDEAPAWARG